MRALIAALLLIALAPGSALAANVAGATAAGQPVPGRGYSASVSGQIAGFRLAGIEPDGDPLYQTVLKTRLSPYQSTPAVNLIVSSYLENFTPDTTPILPDLLHPSRNAQGLGGFLQGKALLTDDAGNVLSIGSFIAEAFLDNSNHAVMRFYGSGSASSPTSVLKGVFHLHRSGSLDGTFTGHLALSPAAIRQLRQHRGATMKPLKQIIDVVTVKPAPMMGKATTGSAGAPLHTGYGSRSTTSTSHPAAHPGGTGRQLSPWTIASGIGVVVSLALAAFLFWSQRRVPSG